MRVDAHHESPHLLALHASWAAGETSGFGNGGAEIRINYESGNERGTNTYWGTPNNPDQPHESDAWRAARRHPPPPVADAEPLVDGLAQLQRAAEARGGADAAVVGLRVISA